MENLIACLITAWKPNYTYSKVVLHDLPAMLLHIFRALQDSHPSLVVFLTDFCVLNNEWMMQHYWQMVEPDW